MNCRWTIRSLNTKNIKSNTTYIKELCDAPNAHQTTVFVCETWLHNLEEYIIEELLGKEWQFTHKSSMEDEYGVGRPHGGLGWIYQKTLGAKVSIIFINQNISLFKTKHTWMIGVYLPTCKGFNIYEETLLTLTHLISSAEREGKNIVLVGDMNADMQRAYEKTKATQQDTALRKWYEEMSLKHELSWVSRLFVQKADYSFANNTSRSLIDYILTAKNNNMLLIEEVNIRQEIGIIEENLHTMPENGTNNSDHRAMEITLLTNLDIEAYKQNESDQNKQTRRKLKLDWTKGDVQDKYTEHLTAKLIKAKIRDKCNEVDSATTENNSKKIDEIVQALHNAIKESIAQTTMEFELSIIDSSSQNPQRRAKESHKTKEIYQLHNKKNEFNRKWLATRNPIYRIVYNHYRRKVRKLEKEQAQANTNSKALKMNTLYNSDKRKLWFTLEEELNSKVNPKIGDEQLIKEYTKMFNAEEGMQTNRNEQLQDKYHKIIKRSGNVKISKYMMKKHIDSLQNGKAAGITGITNEAIKYGGGNLLVLITKIIELFINHHHIPKAINIGLMFPIIKDKKKSVEDINNTRPLTVSEVLITLFEKHVLNTVELMHDGNKLQFGFKRDSSTNHAIFTLRETILENKKREKALVACFLDYSKAFDQVDRDILLLKMTKILDEHHWAALYNYYNNTYIQVRLEQGNSKPISTTIGVKQGGPLSPKLFAIYTDELLDKLMDCGHLCYLGTQCTGIIAYADDTVILSTSQQNLQAAIEVIESYCTEHKIKINTGKRKCMSLGANQNQIAETTIYGDKIEYVKRFKYLGWWIENNLSNKEHIKNRKLAMIISTDRLRKVGINS